MSATHFYIELLQFNKNVKRKLMSDELCISTVITDLGSNDLAIDSVLEFDPK
jgi:hypothetical protein